MQKVKLPLLIQIYKQIKPKKMLRAMFSKPMSISSRVYLQNQLLCLTFLDTLHSMICDIFSIVPMCNDATCWETILKEDEIFNKNLMFFFIL